MKVFMRLFPVFCFLAVILSAIFPARAQSVIRDAEIEQNLRDWATPVFRAAGLQPDNVNLVLIQDRQINAFVAGGPNIFLFTGLIDETETPEELLGVIAHETGHISGGHLIRLRRSVERASFETILGAALGIGAAVLSGEGNAAGAIIGGSQSMATRRLLSNTRANESAADQAGLRFMSQAGIDPTGMITFMRTMESEELLPTSQQSEYMRTHPLTANRMQALERGVEQSSAQGNSTPAEWKDEYARIKAKLTGFLHPEKVAWAYPESDTSIPAQYARAIAAYRQNNIRTALRGVDDLLAAEPDNPYFAELKGQMLMDFGRVNEALPFYRQAVATAPKAGLIKIAYAHGLIESAGQDNAQLQQAVDLLQDAEKDERRSPRVHRLMATAFGRMGQEAEAKLHLAEEAALQGRTEAARRAAQFTVNQAPPGSRTALRAQDILRTLEPEA